jgi:hypothetical protein
VPAPDALAKIMQEVDAVNRDLRAAGAWILSGGLQPASAARVARLQGSSVVVSDGPYARTDEHLGGFTLIEAPDLEAALGWARRLARATTLPIEVRELRERS